MEIKYDKLVREKIPGIIKNDGKNTEISFIDNTEDLRERLISKLSKEVEEHEERFDLVELADILEVIHALIEIVEGKSFREVDKLRERKKEKARRI